MGRRERGISFAAETLYRIEGFMEEIGAYVFFVFRTRAFLSQCIGTAHVTTCLPRRFAGRVVAAIIN